MRRVAAAALLLLLLTGEVAALPPARQTRPTSWAPVVVPPAPTSLPTIRPAPILDPVLTTPGPRVAVDVPDPQVVVVTPRPVVVDPPPGYAGWHHDPNVSWYGPGFYGQTTACGQTLTEGLLGVAHKTLPCGTLVTFRYNGGTPITVPVVDRGPYVAGRTWDLTGATCLALDHCFTGPLDWMLAP